MNSTLVWCQILRPLRWSSATTMYERTKKRIEDKNNYIKIAWYALLFHIIHNFIMWSHLFCNWDEWFFTNESSWMTCPLTRSPRVHSKNTYLELTLFRAPSRNSFQSEAIGSVCAMRTPSMNQLTWRSSFVPFSGRLAYTHTHTEWCAACRTAGCNVSYVHAVTWYGAHTRVHSELYYILLATFLVNLQPVSLLLSDHGYRHGIINVHSRCTQSLSSACDFLISRNFFCWKT